MERELINVYKQYYKEQMMKYDWNYATAFPLATNDRVWSLKHSKSFIHKHILSHIKQKISVRDDDGELKMGIPFYAYYVICKQENDRHYHAHMIFNIQEKYEDYVYKYINSVTGKLTAKLETKVDVVRMIKYMLRKGNYIVDADDERLLPTGYNLGVKKSRFVNK